MATDTHCAVVLMFAFIWILTLGHAYPSNCIDCVPEDELPVAVEQYSIYAFLYALYEHFICAPIIWQWAMLYAVLWLTFKYVFELFYYPFAVLHRYGISENLVKANITLNYERRSAIAANKTVSFLAAVLTVVRCALYMYASNWDYNYLWNSIYVPAPQPILDLLDSFLGYFVFDTIYLFIYNRKWTFMIHHLVVPVATIGVKSFGYGCHLGLPIFVTADATTIFLNLMWFAQDRVKYIQFGIDTNNKVNNSKNKEILQNRLVFWQQIVSGIQLIFGISFLYLRLGQLSYLCIPWVVNVVGAKHVNLFYKIIAVLGNAALLGTSYIWSIHVLKIMYKSVKKLLPRKISGMQDQKIIVEDFHSQTAKKM